MHQILYIHGANCTKTSFNYIREFLPEHKAEFYEYHTDVPALTNLAEATTLLKSLDGEWSIVAHSLGGLIAILLAEQAPDKIDRIVTMSSPFGGCSAANLITMWMKNQLFSDVAPHSNLVRAVQRAKIAHPITSIVTEAGASPFMREPNDGVVSVASQQALTKNCQVKLMYNHSEVLQAHETVDTIIDVLFR